MIGYQQLIEQTKDAIILKRAEVGHASTAIKQCRGAADLVEWAELAKFPLSKLLHMMLCELDNGYQRSWDQPGHNIDEIF